MADRGLIEYDGKTIMTSNIKHMNTDRLNVPLVGTIRCGSPEEEHEEIEEYVSLPASLFGYGDYFILRAKGDSMDLAGIDEGISLSSRGGQKQKSEILSPRSMMIIAAH